jgi:outer membrane protein assembly factor BamD (BamD/ComL family)
VAPLAQMNIGAAREKQSRLFNHEEPYIEAAKAYALAADRYHDRPKIAADAMFKQAMAYTKQARTAEYDQSTAGQAIDTFVAFMTYYPDDPRGKEGERIIASLKIEQARGNFELARYYEKKGRLLSARIYYNTVAIEYPNSQYAAPALERLTVVQKRLGTAAP